MVHKENQTAIQTQEPCRLWYQEEIAQRDRELLASSEHQELMDEERYKELKDRFTQERVKHTELRRSLADLQARKTPSPWNS
eukprot:12906634-Prorocentrum_lima.AAC.1